MAIKKNLYDYCEELGSVTSEQIKKAKAYSNETGCTTALFVLVPTMPVFIYGLHRAEKEQKRQREAFAAGAPHDGSVEADHHRRACNAVR